MFYQRYPKVSGFELSDHRNAPNFTPVAECLGREIVTICLIDLGVSCLVLKSLLSTCASYTLANCATEAATTM